MAQSQIGALQVAAKTAEVVDYHRDVDQPGKPLFVLIPGGLLAMASLAMMLWVAYLTWYKGEIPKDSGFLYVLLLAPIYAGCVFLFCYGYELYDVPKALRLTAIIVFFSVAAVIIVAVLCAVLGESKSSSSESSSSSDSGNSYRGSGTSRGWATSGGGGYWGPISIDAGGAGGTREVIREVPVPVGPTPIVCAFCGSHYTPSETVHSCPHCGAAQPGHPLPVET
jgi:multisubunit Na+/H+ antiporter MnhC subunit